MTRITNSTESRWLASRELKLLGTDNPVNPVCTRQCSIVLAKIGGDA